MTTPFENGHAYNTPGSTESTVGSQIRTDFYYRKALIDAAKEMYFGQLADVRAMPKNMGKTIKQYHYMPILDDVLDGSRHFTSTELVIRENLVFVDLFGAVEDSRNNGHHRNS